MGAWKGNDMAKSNNVRMASEQMRIAQAATRVIRPPRGCGKLTAGVRRNFREIVEEKAKVDWRDHELRIVVQLAKSMELAVVLQNTLIEAGVILINSEGEIKRHPAGPELASVTGSITRLRSTLGLHVATPNPRRDAANRNRIAKQIEWQATEGGAENKMHLLPQ